MRGAGHSPPISTRAVGVATLARQHLLERVAMPAETMIEHLVGMQAQAPFPPYFGLWSRIANFRPEELSGLIDTARVVRIVAMRGTVHLVSARDAAFLRPLVQPIMDGDLLTNQLHRQALDGADLPAIVRAAHSKMADGPCTTTELGAHLSPLFPDIAQPSLVHAVRNLIPVVQAPPRAVWGKSGQVRLVPLEQWAGVALDVAPSLERLLFRYLAAFGPASVADAQTWSGLTKLSEVMERMRPRLVTFTAESGAELFDLPDAPRPDPDTRISVRIVAAFDNVILAHSDRSRILSAEAKAKLSTVNGVFPPVVLVGGQVVGQLKMATTKTSSVITVTPYRRLPKAAMASIAAEARRMSRFAVTDVDVDQHEVTFSEAR